MVQYQTERPLFAVLFGVSTAVMPTFADASTGTDPLPAPAAPSPHAQAQAKEAQRERHFKSKSPNHKESNWFKFPTATKETLSLDWLKRVFSVAILTKILTAAAGSPEAGIPVLQ